MSSSVPLEGVNIVVHICRSHLKPAGVLYGSLDQQPCTIAVLLYSVNVEQVADNKPHTAATQRLSLVRIPVDKQRGMWRGKLLGMG